MKYKSSEASINVFYLGLNTESTAPSAVVDESDSSVAATSVSGADSQAVQPVAAALPANSDLTQSSLGVPEVIVSTGASEAQSIPELSSNNVDSSVVPGELESVPLVDEKKELTNSFEDAVNNSTTITAVENTLQVADSPTVE